MTAHGRAAVRGAQMFTRLATWCHDRRWLVLGIWIAAIVVSNGIA